MSVPATAATRSWSSVYVSRGPPGSATAVTAPNSRAAFATAAGIVWSTRSSGTGVAGGGRADDARQRLAAMIPSVIGLTSDDPRWNAVIARRAAVTALPVVSFEHQRALAVGLLTCERLL